MGYKLKRILIYPDGVTEKQVYPAGWKPGSNTIAYRPLESNANDYSGNNKNGTASGISYTTQNGVKCAYFDGDTNHKVSIPAFGTLSTFTVSLWTNSTYSGTNANCIFGLSPSTDNANFQIYNNYDIVGGSRWNGSNSDYQNTGIDCTDGIWHNIIVSNGSDGMKIYIDGTLVKSSTSVRTVKSDLNYSFIGGWWTTNAPYNGYISNVILEDKVWSAIEASDYYNLTKGNYGII